MVLYQRHWFHRFWNFLILTQINLKLEVRVLLTAPFSQCRRIGPNFRAIPINHQKNWSPANLITSGCGRHLKGRIVRCAIPKQDDFTQDGHYYDSLSEVEQEHLVKNLANDLAGISPEIRDIVMQYFYHASAQLGERITYKMERKRRGE